MATVEAALFDSGRPVLIVPPLTSEPAALGDTVVISWNGSTETARAVSFAMPFLIRARQVVVLTVEGATVEGPSGERSRQPFGSMVFRPRRSPKRMNGDHPGPPFWRTRASWGPIFW